MTIQTLTALVVLLLTLAVGCTAEPAPPPPAPESPAVQPPVTPPMVEPAPPPAPLPAVAQADIEKAAGFFKLLRNDTLAADKKEAEIAATMEANGWTEDTYQALVYDITADAPSRALYLQLLQQ